MVLINLNFKNCFRRLTITDAVEKCLKKGKGQEQSSAANLSSLICFQLGDLADDLKKSLGPLLLSLSRDQSVQLSARAKVSVTNLICT